MQQAKVYLSAPHQVLSNIDKVVDNAMAGAIVLFDLSDVVAASVDKVHVRNGDKMIGMFAPFVKFNKGRFCTISANIVSILGGQEVVRLMGEIVDVARLVSNWFGDALRGHVARNNGRSVVSDDFRTRRAPPIFIFLLLAATHERNLRIRKQGT